MLLSRYLHLDRLAPRNQEDPLLLTAAETIDSTNDLNGRPIKGAWIRESLIARTLLLGWTLYGACCVMADGILTPAVSVISAVAGTVLPLSMTNLGIAVPRSVAQQFHRPYLNRNLGGACMPRNLIVSTNLVLDPTIRYKVVIPTLCTLCGPLVRCPLHHWNNHHHKRSCNVPAPSILAKQSTISSELKTSASWVGSSLPHGS